MSSGNDSDESSDVDSPGPPSLKATQTLLTDSPPVMETPQTSQVLNLNKPQGQQPTASNSATATHNESIYYDVFKQSASSSSTSQNQPSNIVYPASALANIPQEVLLGLIQSGHLQLHTEEDGSGHQYITIPLSMAAAAAATANNNGAGSTQVTDLSSRASASRENASTSSSAAGTGSAAAAAAASSASSSRDAIRVKKEFND